MSLFSLLENAVSETSRHGVLSQKPILIDVDKPENPEELPATTKHGQFIEVEMHRTQLTIFQLNSALTSYTVFWDCPIRLGRSKFLTLT